MGRHLLSQNRSGLRPAQRKDGLVTTSSTMVAPATNKSLVSSELWDRLVNRTIKNMEFQQLYGHLDESAQHDWSERIIEQTLGFLRVLSKTSDGTLSPSPKVDIGWHMFLMYTREYADFCQRIAGRMIHHAPSDIKGMSPKTGGATRATAAMLVHGIYVDLELWGSAAECDGGGGSDSCCSVDGCRT